MRRFRGTTPGHVSHLDVPPTPFALEQGMNVVAHDDRVIGVVEESQAVAVDSLLDRDPRSRN